MAAKNSNDNSELMEKMREEFDEHLKGVFEKNKDFKYTDGLTAETFEEEVKKIPAFINEAPTQEEIDASPALSALQALKYEETDPYEYALAHKEDGNYHFKHDDYHKAIAAYSEGLKQKFEDTDLRVILFTNRAVANFYLGNHRSSLKDSTEALKLNEKHMKAILRAAMCCIELKLFDDCSRWCDKGLQIDPKEKKLINLRQQSIATQKAQGRDKRKREANQRKLLQRKMKLISAFKERCINIEGCTDSQSEVLERIKATTENQPQDDKIYLDENERLHWPVYFLYPEFNQSDFIQDFCEDDRFIDHLNMMFDENSLPDWDTKKIYRKENLQIFYEDRQRNVCVKIPSSTTLTRILGDKRYVVRNGAPGFLVLSTASEYYNEFQKTMKIESY